MPVNDREPGVLAQLVGLNRLRKKKSGNGATLGFESTLWKAADKLRKNMDAAEYKHVVLGLLFLKDISDAFERKHAELTEQVDEGADPEHPDEYLADGVFWVPPGARWSHIQNLAKQPVAFTAYDGTGIPSLLERRCN